MRLLYLTIACMFAQQSFATMSKTVTPVISLVIVDALGVSPALVGVFVTMNSGAGMIAAIGCGGSIVRYGTLRMSQISLMVMAARLAFGAGGTLVIVAIMAIVVGCSPISTPVGLMLSGLLGPLYVSLFGWQGALVAIGAMCPVLAAVLQPMRAEFDADRDPTHPLSPRDVKTTILAVLTSPALRTMTLATYTFVGLQFIFSVYFVIFLAKGLDHSLTMAGFVFSIAMIVAVPARILWGWIGSRFLSPRRLLGVLGVGMAAASAAMGLFTPAWFLPAIVAVATVFSATVLNWHGVLLAELAHIAPEGQVGPMTGGVLAFGGADQMTLPLAFGALLALSGSYSYGFFVAAALALATALFLLWRQRPTTPDNRKRSWPR